MKRRRLPRWCRHPWKPLPKRWHRWRRCQRHARLTKREINFLVRAVFETPVRRSRITRIDRVTIPFLTFMQRRKAHRQRDRRALAKALRRRA